jgi:ubiquitin-protein ligase
MTFQSILTELICIFTYPNEKRIINKEVGMEYLTNYATFEEMSIYWTKKKNKTKLNAPWDK